MSGQELHSLRIARGWSRERLARELSISASTIQRWEAGEPIPGPSVIALRALLQGVVPAGAPMADSGGRS